VISLEEKAKVRKVMNSFHAKIDKKLRKEVKSKNREQTNKSLN